MPASLRHLTAGIKSSEDLSRTVERLIEVVENLDLRYTTLETSLKRIEYAVPAKPRDGQFARADGVTWNPGAGAGLYQYQSGAWVKL